MTEYIIPYQDAESEFTEKRSRFITHLYKVETEAEMVVDGNEAHAQEWKDALQIVAGFLVVSAKAG